MDGLHNIINHFTVALVNLGVIFELVGYAVNRPGMRNFAWTALRLSVGFAILSLVTGYVTEGTLHAMVEKAKPVNAYHKTVAFITVGLLAVTVILRMSTGNKINEPQGAGLRGAYLTLLMITFVLMSATGYLGMELTYGYGVNVEPYERIIESLPQGTSPEIAPTQPPMDSALLGNPNSTTIPDSITR
jgi:uncharacterized membrane protein